MFVVSRVVRGRRAVWRATRACSSHSGGLPPVWTPQNIDEGTFHGIADDTLHAIDEALTDSDVPPSAMDVQLTVHGRHRGIAAGTIDRPMAGRRTHHRVDRQRDLGAQQADSKQAAVAIVANQVDGKGRCSCSY